MSAFFAWLASGAVSLWSDRGRVLAAALIGAMIWYLLGQKVEDTFTFYLPVRAVSGSEEMPQGQFVVIRVPTELAFCEVHPEQVPLVLRGTRQDLAEAREGNLRGVYVVPPDFCGNEKRKTRDIFGARDLQFAKLKTLPSVRIDQIANIELTIGERRWSNVKLEMQNLEFEPGINREGVEVEFEPTLMVVSGPYDEVGLFEQDRSRLKLPQIDRATFDAAFALEQSIPASRAYFSAAGPGMPPLRGLTVTEPDRMIQIRFRRQRLFVERQFDNVEISQLIPKSARREDVDPARPVDLEFDSVSVKVRVPEDYFAKGRTEAELRRELNVFVDLGEMPFERDAQRLKIRHEGLPEGATATVEPADVDAKWRRLAEHNGTGNE